MDLKTLLASGYVEADTILSTDDTLVFNVAPGHELVIKGDPIAELQLFTGPECKTFTVRRVNAQPEGTSQWARFYQDEDLPITINRIERTTVLSG